MAAPSKTFTVITDGRVDADSPVDETLMEDLRDNDIHLEEWLGGSYTAAVDHDHNGTNSKKFANEQINSAAIDKSGTEDNYSVPGSSSYTPPAGFYVASDAGFFDVEAMAYLNSAWRQLHDQADGIPYCWYDGSNMRWTNNNSSPRTVYYRKRD